MSWFRRRSRPADVPARAEVELSEEDLARQQEEEAARLEEEAAEQALRARREALLQAQEERARTGPFDVSEADAEERRVDLGALRVPPQEGMELRLELDQKSQRVVGVTVALGRSSVHLQAFAAPRRDGVWEDIRGEIAAQVTKQGGTADEVPGTFGREVLARMPARTPDGRTGHQVARFTGVDGPRWFLRAVFHGEAAVDEEAAADLERIVRGTVVVRGDEAMAPRDLLALTLPAVPDATAGDGAGTDSADQATEDGDTRPAPTLDALQRGPEITEIR